jgi:hypothetical protein
MRGGGFFERDHASGASRSRFSPIGNPSDRFEEAVGFLVELPDFEGSPELRAARLLGAMSMLARSGFKLVLLPVEAAVPVRRATRRWWRR